MSRRKQANPKSFKLADDLKTLTKQQQQQHHNLVDEIKIKIEPDFNSTLNESEENKTNRVEEKEEEEEEKQSSRSSRSSSYDSSFDTRLTNNENLKDPNDDLSMSNIKTTDFDQESNDTKNTNTLTSHDNNISNRTNRQHLKQQQQNEQQKQTSILINGKRYYPLKFTCENCGLRYSDQSTLITHKQNYCSKRRQTSSTRSSSSSSSSVTSSNRSLSASPTRPLSNSPLSDLDDEKINNNNNNIEIKFSKIDIEKKEDNSDEITNNRDHEEITTTNNSNTTTVSNNNMQLVKSVIFQCNSCLFQTDKKSIMNRHSRVHLAQKRKAMEEQTTTGISSSSSSEFNPNLKQLKQSKNDEKSNNLTTSDTSYCKDCDIQFSSASTYLHHRNNYCQKFSTIEAVVVVDSNIKSKIDTNSNQDNTNSIKSKSQTQQQQQEQQSKSDSKYVDQNKVLKSDDSNQISKTINYLPYSNLVKSVVTTSQPLPPQTTVVSTPTPIITPARIPTPPGAVQMGDLVYIPVYKVTPNNYKKPINLTKPFMPIPTLFDTNRIKENLVDSRDDVATINRPNSNESAQTAAAAVAALNQMRNLSNSPLDLSLKNQSKLAAFLPPKLKSTSSLVQPDLDPNYLLKQTYHQQQLLYYKEKELEYINSLNRKLQHDNYLKLTSSVSSPYRLPFEAVALASTPTSSSLPPPPPPPTLTSQSMPFVVSMDAMKLAQHEQQIQNKIYHCTNCQQLFFKLKLFKQHACVTAHSNNNNNNNNKQINKLPKPIISEIEINSRRSSTSSVESEKQSPTELVEKSKLSQIQINENFLKHPLVKKTIQEIYDKSADGKNFTNDTNSNRNFFICTTCGYRGNTLRGVKQHGKLHLSNREQFAIINMTDKEPILAYNSADDNELQLQMNTTSSQKRSFSLPLNNNNSINSNIESFNKANKRVNSEDESNEESNDNVCKIPITLITNQAISAHNSKISPTYSSAAIQSNSIQPISKKARLLDSHYNQQKILNDEIFKNQDNQKSSSSSSSSSMSAISSASLNENKSQTYCSKCNIQFQHINNFLAHKSNYCKS